MRFIDNTIHSVNTRDIPDKCQGTPRPNLLTVPCAGKGGSKTLKNGLRGVKRKAHALLDREGAEPSETGLSDGSALPGTTETSARCMSVSERPLSFVCVNA